MNVYTKLISVLSRKLRNLLILPEGQGVSWRLHSHKGCPHHTVGLFRKRHITGKDTSHVIRKHHHSPPAEPGHWLMQEPLLSPRHLCCHPHQKMNPVHHLLPPVSFFYSKLLIGYSCRWHVYIPVSKKLGKMSCVFSLRVRTHNKTTSLNTTRLITRYWWPQTWYMSASPFITASII